MKAKPPENKINDKKFNFKIGPIIKVVKAINKLRKRGTKIKAKGINNLKLSSNVSEFVIHEIPLKKKPNPKNNPVKKKFFLYGFFR